MSRRGRYVLGGILLASAAVRVWRLGFFSYGLDEILQGYWVRARTWAWFWKSLKFDAIHPPLDYVVDRLAAPAIASNELLKLLPVVWGCATVAVFGVVVARRAGETAGLAAAALLALAPYHVRYSQELRPYSLSLLLICLSLWALDAFLARPAAVRLALLYLACLATAYALYTAAFVLALAAAAMLAEDAFAPDGSRRRTARRFLLLSPAFGLALWLGYLPWWPVVRDFASRPPVAAAPALTLARVGRIVTFFAFASDDTWRLGRAGALFAVLAAAGLAVALARRGTRCLAAWGIGGLAGIEILGRIHPHYDFVRRFVPAGPGLTALAAVALAALLARSVTRLAGAALLAAVLVLDGRGLRVYFLQGRADWRTLADYLRAHADPSERVFTENQYAQLCTAYYLVGPRWLEDVETKRPVARDLPNLEGEAVRLTWAWRPGARAWLVLAGEPRHPELRRWAEAFPGLDFPKAEGAVLRRLDPDRRDASLALISGAHGP